MDLLILVVVQKQRHSVVSVSYFNMDSKEIDFEVVEDATATKQILERLLNK